MDCIQEFYNDKTYPEIKQYLEYCNGYLERLSDGCMGPAESTIGKSIASVGCGTIQPTLIGIHHPFARITAVDVSKNSIYESIKLAKQNKILNITHINSDFMNVYNEYDFVIATGVIHHVADTKAFLNHCYDSTKENGIFRGFVYNLEGRKEIKQLSKYFIENEYNVDQIKDFFKITANTHFESHSKQDSEIIDTWLNPRFKEYTKESFIDELTDTKWHGCGCDLQISESKAQLFFDIKKDIIYVD